MSIIFLSTKTHWITLEKATICACTQETVPQDKPETGSHHGRQKVHHRLSHTAEWEERANIRGKLWMGAEWDTGHNESVESSLPHRLIDVRKASQHACDQVRPARLYEGNDEVIQKHTRRQQGDKHITETTSLQQKHVT